MRAGIRYAWAPAWSALVRLVLRGLGSAARLLQLRSRGNIKRTIRRTPDRWCGILVRHMESAALSAGEGKRVLASAGGVTDEPDFDVFMAAIASEDDALAKRLSIATKAAVYHQPDGLIQIIVSERYALALLNDARVMSIIVRAARLLDHQCEVHITWPEPWKNKTVT